MLSSRFKGGWGVKYLEIPRLDDLSLVRWADLETPIFSLTKENELLTVSGCLVPSWIRRCGPLAVGMALLEEICY